MIAHTTLFHRPAWTVYHLKLDCDHKRAGGNDETTTTSAQVCAKFVARHIEDQTDDVHEDCVIAPDSCPEFYVTIPSTETLMYVSVQANGEDSLLVDAWQLEMMSYLNLMGSEGEELGARWGNREGEALRTWWGDGEGARCLTDQCNNDCWPNILGAEYGIKGVNLYMSSDIAEQYEATAVGDWSNVLYEDGHCCELKYQRKSKDTGTKEFSS